MKDLVRNPIGIVALFISLIYGFASLLLGATASALTPSERFPLIVFIVAFPMVVLGVFYLLVSRHHGKLYSPGDFKDDKSFLRTLSKEEVKEKLEREVAEALPVPEPDQRLPTLPVRAVTHDSGSPATSQLIRDIEKLEEAAIALLAKEYGKEPRRNIEIARVGVNFDALLTDDPKAVFAEVKYIRRPLLSNGILDRILYNALLADRALSGHFKLVLLVVYEFDEAELPRLEQQWRRRIEQCPADIELRFLQRAKLDA